MRSSRTSAAWILALAAGCAAVALASEPFLLWEASLSGDGDRRLRWPGAVASAAPDELVAADAFHRELFVFRELDGEWRLDRTLPLPGTPVALVGGGPRYFLTLRGPSALVAVDRGRWALHPVALPLGTIPGALSMAEVDGLLVHDLAGRQVLTLAPAGSVLHRTPVPGRPGALAPAPGGGIYVAYPDRAVVTRLRADGEPDGSFPVPGDRPTSAWPTALEAGERGYLLVLDRHGGRVLRLDARGNVRGLGSRRGWEPGLLRFPADLTRLAGDRLAVADQGNGRVQIFRLRTGDGDP